MSTLLEKIKIKNNLIRITKCLFKCKLNSIQIGKTSLITHNILSRLQLRTQTLKSVYLRLLSFNLFSILTLL
jgi:hypothetical protein